MSKKTNNQISNKTTASNKSNTSNKSNKENKQNSQVAAKVENPFSKAYVTLCSIYSVFLLLGYVLICPEGYVTYDGYKRMILLVGGGIFLLMAAVYLIMSAGYLKKDPLVKKFQVADYCVCALLVTGILGAITAQNKAVVFMGDSYRCMGYGFLAVSLLGWMIASHFGKVNKVFIGSFVAISAITYIWQILNYHHIDPLNWQMDFQYTGLVATLANIDQNAVFDGFMIAATMGLLIVSTKLWEKALYTGLVFLGFLAGMETRAESVYPALFLGIVVAAGYVFYRKQGAKELAMAGSAMWLAVLVQRFEFPKYIDYWYSKGPAEEILTSNKGLAGLAVLIAILWIYSLLEKKIPEKVGKAFFYIYLGFVVIAIIGMVVVCMRVTEWVNAHPDEYTPWAQLALTKNFGSGRGAIWDWCIRYIKETGGYQKLFGSGLGHFTAALYPLFGAEIKVLYPEEMLADAHNAFLDLLVTTGVVGFLSYIGFLGGNIFYNIKHAKENPKAIVSVIIAAAYIGASLLNSNLIIAFPVACFLMGMFDGGKPDIEKEKTVTEKKEG